MIFLGAKDGVEVQTSLLSRTPEVLTQAMGRMAAAILTGSLADDQKAKADYAQVVGDGLILSDVLGRKRTLLEAEDAARRAPEPPEGEERIEPVLFGARHSARVAAALAPVSLKDDAFVPKVRFEEAIRDLTSRDPVIARSAAEVAELYRTRDAFAITNSSYEILTKRIRDEIVRLRGKGAFTAKEVLSNVGGFSRAYAETVYRTNLSTAYTNGRIDMARDPVVNQVIGALLYVATRDSDVRPNHLAADGLIASQHDRLWLTFRPPMGYNCRCGLRMVDRWDLEEMGLIEGNLVKRRPPATFRKAHPDPGFGRRVA